MFSDPLLGRPERWASILGWATLAGVEFGLIGPFGSYAASPFARIAYWTALFWMGSVMLWPCLVAAIRLGPRKGFPPVFSGVALVLIVCVPLAALGAFETWLFWPGHAARMRTLDWYGLTIVVALPAITALAWLDLRNFRQQEVVEPKVERDALALPDHMLTAALCLQMEDHYVRIHLDDRSLLHFAVMREAVKALEDRDGAQVHRSWWVAREAVQGWYREDRAVTLILVNGLRVPVARNRVAILREAGWLTEERQAA